MKAIQKSVCGMASERAAHLEPPRVRWKNDQVCLTSLRTGGATVQWKVNISGA